jgi:hypothetical protein
MTDRTSPGRSPRQAEQLCRAEITQLTRQHDVAVPDAATDITRDSAHARRSSCGSMLDEGFAGPRLPAVSRSKPLAHPSVGRAGSDLYARPTLQATAARRCGDPFSPDLSLHGAGLDQRKPAGSGAARADLFVHRTFAERLMEPSCDHRKMA